MSTAILEDSVLFMRCFQASNKGKEMIRKITHAIDPTSDCRSVWRGREWDSRECNAKARNLEKTSATSQDELSRILACTNGKPFCSFGRSRIARLCQECRVGSFAATTYIPEYGITPEVRSPWSPGIPNSLRIPAHLPRPAPEILTKVHLAKHRQEDGAKRLLASTTQIKVCPVERDPFGKREVLTPQSINDETAHVYIWTMCAGD